MWLKARTAAGEVRREKGRKSTGSLEGQFKDVSSALAGVALVYRAVACEPESQVLFPVRAHARVAGQVPSRGTQEATTHISLPLFLPPFPPLLK